MIAFGGTDMPVGEHFYCPFAGRRDGKHFVYSHEQLMQKYQANMRMVDRIPDALSGAMGNQMYVATFPTFEEMEQFYADVLAVTDENNDAIQQELVNVLALGEPAAKALIPKPNLSPRRQAHHGRDEDHDQGRHQDGQPEEKVNDEETSPGNGLNGIVSGAGLRFEMCYTVLKDTVENEVQI